MNLCHSLQLIFTMFMRISEMVVLTVSQPKYAASDIFLHVTYFDMFLKSYPFASFSFLLDFHLCSNFHCFLLLFGILNTCFVFLLQLSALLSDVGLNIREAHVFSTADGYSLDVFVVDGWHSEVYCLSL